MSASTAAFTLTSAAYQDVSEGYELCTFRLPFISQKDNVIRVHRGANLPDAETTDFDEFKPSSKTEEGWVIHHSALSETDRVYVRAARASVHLVAYRL